MFKKIFFVLILTILLIPTFLYAQQKQQGVHEPGTGLEGVEEMEINKNEKEVELIMPVRSQNQDQDKVNSFQKNVKLENKDQIQIKESQQNQVASSRRSRVANSIQEMERIATRNQGIGEQVRIIAQSQNQNQEEAENLLVKAQERGKFTKFFIGPNYSKLKDTQEKLENCKQNLVELKELKEQVQVQVDQDLLNEQIEIMEQVIQEMTDEVVEEEKGFTLFGWLVKLFIQ